MDGSHNFDGAARLSPEMASRRLQVLAFVRSYIATWRKAPSQNEIAAGLGIARTTVRYALRRLADEGLILRGGGERGIALPDERAAALRVLAGLGYRIVDGNELALIGPRVLDYRPIHSGRA